MSSDTRERYARGQWINVSDWFELLDEDRRSSDRTRKDPKFNDEAGSARLGFRRGKL